MMQISGLDHLVLTVRDVERTVSFYTTVLGMEKRVGPTGRVSLHFGHQKINLHTAGAEFMPAAARPTPGSADLCFIVDHPRDQLGRELERLAVAVIEGPLARTGGVGPLISWYIRDPDGNLIELAHYE